MSDETDWKDMEIRNITVNGEMIDFNAVRKAADEISQEILREPFLVAWYDGIAGIGHPDVHECTSKPGWQTYGENRGGCLTVDVNNGSFILIYTETSVSED
ncbi:MAG: AF1514 family protein [Thermoleophilia bacterium]|nr:AF1514 family protein [Thermoleophilia bacterium]